MVRYDIETDWDYAYVTCRRRRQTSTPICPRQHKPERPELRQRHHRRLRRQLGRLDRRPVCLRGPDGRDRLPLLDRRRPRSSLASRSTRSRSPVSRSTALSPTPGWTFDGFRTTTGSETLAFFNAYVVENRQYIGYDRSLDVGPYNFGFRLARLCRALPIPGRSADLVLGQFALGQQRRRSPGRRAPPSCRLPPGDRNVERRHADASAPAVLRLHLHQGSDRGGQPASPGGVKTITSKPGNSVFNDTLRDGDGTSIYWAPGHPSDNPSGGRYQAEWNSVNVPDTGTIVRVKSISSTGMMVLQLQ